MVRRIFVPMNRLNILALVAGIIMLYLLYTGAPWWTLTAVGDTPTFKAEIAPYLISVIVLGKPLEAPILKYMVLSGYLTYLLAGITCIVGAFAPGKKWSKTLIGNRALTIPIITVITIYIGLYTVKNYIGISIPITGDEIIRYTLHYGDTAVDTYTPIEVSFTQTYYIAIIAGVLAVIGRIMIRKEKEES